MVVHPSVEYRTHGDIAQVCHRTQTARTTTHHGGGRSAGTLAASDCIPGTPPISLVDSNPWCAVRAGAVDCSFATWQACRTSALACRTREALLEDKDRALAGLTFTTAPLPDGGTGATWCLADPEANPPLCRYPVYEDCAAAKPDSRYRCVMEDTAAARAADVPSVSERPRSASALTSATAQPAPSQTATTSTDSLTARRLREPNSFARTD